MALLIASFMVFGIITIIPNEYLPHIGLTTYADDEKQLYILSTTRLNDTYQMDVNKMTYYLDPNDISSYKLNIEVETSIIDGSEFDSSLGYEFHSNYYGSDDGENWRTVFGVTASGWEPGVRTYSALSGFELLKYKYYRSEAIKQVYSHNFNQQKNDRLVNALRDVNTCRSVFKAKELYQDKELEYFNQTLKYLSSLGINPVTISQSWGIQKIPNLLDTFFNQLPLSFWDKNSQCHKYIPLDYRAIKNNLNIL